VFTEHVRRVDCSRDVVEANDGSSNSLSNTMKGQGLVTLVQLGMWNGGAIHNRLVISKHEGCLVDRYTEISKGSAILGGAFDTRACCDKLGTICRSFDSSLLLAVPIHRGSIEQIEYASDGTSSHIVVIEIGVDVVRDANVIAKWLWSIMWNKFLHIAVDGFRPVKVILGNA